MLADVNFWLALVLSGHAHHGAVAEWFDQECGPAAVEFCRLTQLSLTRLLTTEAVLAPYGVRARTMGEAWDILDGLMADERVTYLPEPEGVEESWRSFASGRRASPKLWMDAYLAAMAFADGRAMLTLDRGFRQFRGLQVILLPR